MDNFIDVLKHVLKDASKGVKGYFKSRLIIMTITFVILSIGLSVIDAPLPVLMAFIISIIDIIPLLGSGIILIPWAIISYFWGVKELGVSLGVLYVVMTILKQFIEPKILGDQIGIRPLYTFLATVVGSFIFGPVGLILGPIIAVIINSILKTRNMLNNKK